MAATIAHTQPRTTTHVVIRLVRPGSWQPCVHCHETIEFVPGGDRAQATAKEYEGASLRRVEHWHAECFREWGDPDLLGY